ncbi:MAG: DUF5606 domain-containing protein [Bacteroidales bacterium]|nr:DUF5606 domain-containing protein [Bacteroidales bacterium]
MDLSKILAISGKPGLYKMLSQNKSGFIVESLTDGKRFPVFTHERVSSLGEISIFTTVEEDLPLKEIFKKIHAKTEGKQAPDASSDGETIKKFFLEAIPEYDPERVYVSDMKKAIAWYNLLLDKEMMDFTEEEEVKETEAGQEEAKIIEPEQAEKQE